MPIHFSRVKEREEFINNLSKRELKDLIEFLDWAGVGHIKKYKKEIYKRIDELETKKISKRDRKKILNFKELLEEKEKIDKRHKEWVTNNKERVREHQKKYYESKKGMLCKLKKRLKRKENINNVICTLTNEEWLEILDYFNYHCAYCNRKFDKKNKPTKDHIIPITKGGSHTKENIVPACLLCNVRKSNKLLLNFV
jgi:5-methylcytosine-specific restriction endonuclease McrA